MCGRYTVCNLQRVRAKFGVPEAPLFEPRYNVASTEPVLAVKAKRGARERKHTLSVCRGHKHEDSLHHRADRFQ